MDCPCKTEGQGAFFLLWPLFARAPRHWFLENFLLSAPGVQSVFFFVALRWAPRPFGGARAKKKHHPGCFFFCCGPGERQGKEKPRWKPARGQSKKKNTTQGVFFFAPAPGKGRGRRSPLWPRAGAQRGFSFPCLSPGPEQKKKHPGWCFYFFALAPCWHPTGLLLPLTFPGAGAKKKKTPYWVVFYFLLWPRAASNGASPSLAFRRGRSKKKTPYWVVFFFVAAAPRGRSLTHCGPGWRCLPLAGAVFFFCCGRGGVFFCCGPAGTLTHSRWAGAISARPGWCFFFLLRPRPDRGGVFFFAVAPPGRSLTHCGLGRFRQGPGGVFFFAAAPPGRFRQ